MTASPGVAEGSPEPRLGALAPDLWAGVDRLIDRAPTLADLRAHGLHLLAARRWRRLRREAPRQLVEEEMSAACTASVAAHLLRSTRDAYDGQIMVVKGPHAATYYPASHLRPYRDLDILVDDPQRAQRALISAGFVPVGFPDDYYDGLHHLRPLCLPGSPLPVEIHRRPNWLDWADPPPRAELLGAGVPDALGIPGLLALPPAHHALILAAHAWTALPLRRLSDLVDVAAAAGAADPGDLATLARRWDMVRVWETTIAAANALLLDAPIPLSLKIWGRNLGSVRDRTVLETHVRRLVSPFWALAPIGALGAAGTAVARAAMPAPSDSWRSRLARSRRAFSDRSLPSAEHARRLGPDAHRPPKFRRSGR